MSTCTNCGADHSGSYCPDCGQKKEIRKLTFKSIAQEFGERIFGFDSKFGRTLKDLTLRPGIVPQHFINGNRVKYMGPVAYYFSLLTIYILLISLLDIDIVAMTRSTTEFFTQGKELTEDQQLAQSKVQELIFSYFRLFSFIQIPFFTTAQLLLFRKNKLNFIEHSVVTFYGQAHPLLLSIFLLFPYLIDINLSMNIVLVISLTYFALICGSFYKGNRIWNFIKGLLSQFLGFLFFFLFAMLVFIIIAFLIPGFFGG